MSHLISFASSLNLFISAQELFLIWGNVGESTRLIETLQVWDMKLSAPPTLHITRSNWIHQNIRIRSILLYCYPSFYAMLSPTKIRLTSIAHVASKIIHSPTPNISELYDALPWWQPPPPRSTLHTSAIQFLTRIAELEKGALWLNLCSFCCCNTKHIYIYTLHGSIILVLCMINDVCVHVPVCANVNLRLWKWIEWSEFLSIHL